MGNNSTFLHYFKCLVLVVAAMLLPGAVNAQVKKDLTESLDGWHLLWGSYNSNGGGYDWTRCGASATGGSGDAGVEKSGASFMPDVDAWKNDNKTDAAWPNVAGGGFSVCAPRFYINGISGTGKLYDPVYNPAMGVAQNYCFYTVPDGYSHSFRLGTISSTADGHCFATEYSDQASGKNKYNYSSLKPSGTYKTYSSAEGAYYDLYVTPENSLVTINYVYVASDPECGNTHSSSKNASAPSFEFMVLKPTQSGEKTVYDDANRVTCGSDAISSCAMSGSATYFYKGNNSSNNFFYRGFVHSPANPWKSAIYDLHEFVGKTVRIKFLNHDCVYNGDVPGGHSGYLYFTVRTSPVKLDVKYCKNTEPIRVEAPYGFSTYNWYGVSKSGNKTAITAADIVNGRILEAADASRINQYETLRCVMHIDGLDAECDVTLDTLIAASNLEAVIKPVLDCNMFVNLTDATKFAVKGDSASVREWFILDKKYGKNESVITLENKFAANQMVNGQDYVKHTSDAKTVSQKLDPNGQWIRLYVENINGCESYTYMYIVPNPLPVVDLAPVRECAGAPLNLQFKSNAAYNALSQTATATETFYCEQYSNLSSDLTFEVKKKDGTVVTCDHVGLPILMGEASTAEQHFNYVATDRWGCKLNGVYDVVVDPQPYLKLNPDLTPTKVDGVDMFYICPGKSVEVGAFSTNAKNFHWNTETTESEVGTVKDGNYYSKKYQLNSIGIYRITVHDDTERKCSSELMFNVDYKPDAVELVKPEKVCPFETSTVTLTNTKGIPVWWEELDGHAGTKVNTHSGVTYPIDRPNGTSTYYCDAVGLNGCDYHHSFQLDVTPIRNNEFTFQNMVSGEQIAPAKIVKKNDHRYELPTMCNSDELSITAISPELTAKHAWKIDVFETDFTEATELSPNYTKGGFVPRANQTMEIIWRTIPVDADGNDMCVIYDTIAVMGYPQIQSKVTVNGLTNNFHACDNGDVKLAVTPNFYTQDPDRAKFTIQWTDVNGGYTDGAVAFDETVTADLNNAISSDNGKVYTYKYRITSKDGGCFADFEVPVYINPLPSFELTAEPENLCLGKSVIVTAADDALGQTYVANDNPTVTTWVFPNPGNLTETVNRNAAMNSVNYSGITANKTLTVKGVTNFGCAVEKTVDVVTAVVPELKVEIYDAFNNKVSAVCAGSEYMLKVTDLKNAEYSKSDCSDDQWVTVTRKSAPYQEISWQETANGDIKQVNNKILKHVYDISGTNFGNYTARKVSTSATEYYDITINSPCGCVASITDFEVPVNPAPVLTISQDVNKDFLCPNGKMNLTAKTDKADASNTFKYYWTIGNRQVQPGDLEGAVGGQNSDKVKTIEWTDEAESFFYNAQVFDGQCYAQSAVRIYNQVAPDFTVTADPAEMCQNGASQVTLMGNSSDPAADYYKYYLKNSTSDYATATSWENNQRIINNVKNALYKETGKIYVRAGVSRLVGSDNVRVNSENYYCYAEKPVEIDLTINPDINVVVKRADGTTFDRATKKLCPGEQYSLTVNNPKGLADVQYKITITDKFNSLNTYSKTVWATNPAVFNQSNIAASFDRPTDIWNVTITPVGSTQCLSQGDVNINVSSHPVFSIEQDGGRKTSVDTVAFCVNYYQLAQGNSATSTNPKQVSVKTAGVNLSADLETRPGYTYTYLWEKKVNGATQTIADEDKVKPTINASVEASVSSYVHFATYTLTVTDNFGCSASKSMTIAAEDAPRPFNSWTANPGHNGHQVLFYNACQNSETTINIYEEQRNIRVKDATIPHYTYEAYDLNNVTGYDLSKYDQYGYGINTESLTNLSSTFGEWTTSSSSGLGTLKDKTGTIVSDSVTIYTRNKQIKFPIGTDVETKYMVAVTDTLGCTGYLTINYNPHELVDIDKFHFKVAVNQGGTENIDKMADFKVAGTIDPVGNDTVAYVCPGDVLVFTFADLTAYDAANYKKNNPWNYSDNYRVGVEFANVATPYSAWTTANTLTDPFSFSTGRTISGPQRMRLIIQRNSDGHGSCPVYSNWFWVSIADSPKLLSFGDNACRLDQDGNEDGVIKFRAASNAPAGSVHHYQWVASDKQTLLENGGDITIKDYTDENGELQKNALLEYRTNFRKEDFGTGSNKSVTVYLRDAVDGYCRSADLGITRYVYQNPEFDITIPDGNDYVCNGEEVTFRVTQDYNWCRCGWQYYYNSDKNITTYECSMYNDQVNRTSCSSPTTFPHYYEKSYQVTKPDDMINVTSYWNTGSPMTYQINAGQTVNLYCYTHKSLPIHALENPDPHLNLVVTEDAGLYKKDDIIMSVSKERPDSVGSRVACPETDYKRVFRNNNPDHLTGYQQTQTTYYIKNVTQGGDYVPYTATSTANFTDNSGYKTNNDYFQMYAKTDNGCTSEPITFRLPLGKNPDVEIRHTLDGVCADNHENTIDLVAVATNQPKSYKWYHNFIHSGNIEIDDQNKPIDAATITVHPVGETPTPYTKDVVNYFVEVTNESGCSATASTEVGVYPIPQFDLSLLTPTPCENSTVKLEMKKSAAEFNYVDDKFAYQYADKTPIAVTESAYTTADLSVGSGKTFTVNAIVNATQNVQCAATRSINVTTNGIPEPTVQIFADEKSGIYNANAQIANGAKLCPGTKYHLEFKNNAFLGTCSPDQYEVRMIVGTTVTNLALPSTTVNTLKTPSFTLDDNTTFQYRLKSGCGCESGWQTISLEITQNPVISISGTNKVEGEDVSLFCDGTDQEMTLTASAGNAQIKTWKWEPDVTGHDDLQSQTFVPDMDREFKVTGTTEFGCSAVGTYSVKSLQSPTLVPSFYDITVCEGSNVELSVKNTNEEVQSSITYWSSTNGQTWNTATGDESKISPRISETSTFTVYAVANNELKCPSRKEVINVVSAKKPDVLVELYTNGAKFLPSEKALCPGTQFYPVFKNKNGNPAICNNDEFEYWEVNSTAEHYKSTVSAGTLANGNLTTANKFTMGESSSTYQYRAKTSCGCESTLGTFTVSVAPIPEVSVSGAVSYCEGSTSPIELTAQSAANITTWLWSANVTTATTDAEKAADRAEQTVSVVPTAKENKYILYGTSADGCTSKPYTHTIVQKELPTINFAGSPEFACLGNVANVKANITVPENTSLLSTVWTPADASKIADDEVTYIIDKETKFKVTAYTENGCEVTSSDWTVKPYKVPDATVTIKTLNAFGKYAANETLTDGTAVCAGTSFYPLFVSTTAATEEGVCEDDIITLTCNTTGEKYEISAKSGTFINNGNDRKSFVMNDQDLNFTYQLHTSCGCYGPTHNFSIKLASAPTVKIVASKTEFCEGSTEQITLKATVNETQDANMTWKWTSCPTDKPTLQEQKFQPTATATYIVTGKSNDGCEATEEITLTKLEVPVPVVSSDAEGNKVCYGTRVNLSVFNNNENNAPLGNVTWTSDLGHNLSGISVPFTSNATATFTAVATAQNGCSATAEPITITTAASPAPSVKLYRLDGTEIVNAKLCPGEQYYPVFKNTTGSSTCDNDVYTITSADGVQKFAVTAPGGGDANQGGGAFKLTMGENSQVFNYSVKTSCGCESSMSSFMVGVAQIPTVTISGVDDYCSNTNPNITLTANSSADIAEYEWSTLVPSTQRGEKTVVVTPVGTQEFSVRVKSTDGCWSAEEAHHTITAKPTPLAVLDAESEVCLGSKAGIKANITLAEGTTLNNTVWSPATGITKVKDDSITATINAATNFSVTVNASNGCSYTSEAITVSPIEHPVANVELRYADGEKAGNAFDPAVDELCLGAKFYPVFTNSVNTSTCTIDTFILRSGDIVDKFPVAAGSKANDNAAKTYVVNGATTYFYSVKTSCGCESDAVKSYSIKVATSPTITVVASGLKGANGNQYCEGDFRDVTLKANSSVVNTTYVWDSPISTENDANKNAEVTVKTGTTTYKVTGTSPSGCKSEAEFTMEMLPKPSVTVTGDAQVCAGSKATLTAESADGTSYLWSYNALTSKTITPEVTANKTFSVTAFSDLGCPSDPYEFEVSALARPTITFEYSGIKNTSNVCDGDVLSITANAQNSNATFKWYSDAARTAELTLGEYVTEINGATITVKPITNSPTNYYVTANLEGCESKDNAQVKAYSLPKFNVIGKTTYCEGQDLELAISEPANKVKYFWDGNVNPAENYKLQNVNKGITNVIVIAEDENSCRFERNVPITVNTAPVVVVTPSSASVCPNGSVELAASGADSYTWTQSGKNETVLGRSSNFKAINLTENIVYRVLGLNTNTQCYDYAFVAVSVKNAPSLTLQTPTVDGKVNVCDGNTGVLTVMGAENYTWTTPVESSTGGSAVIKPTYSRDYHVIGENDGCTAELVIPVLVVASPTVTLTSSAVGVCSGNEVTLTATVNGSNTKVEGMTYSWSDAPREESNVHKTTLTSDQTFELTVQQGNSGCLTTVSKTVKAYPIPSAEIVSDLRTVCRDSIVKLSAVANGGTPNYTYKWSRSESNNTYSSETISPNVRTETEEFYLTVIDAHLCESEANPVTIFTQAKRELKNLAPEYFCEGERDSFRVNMQGASEYTYGGSGVWTSKNDTVFYRATSGEYSVPVVGRVPLDGAPGRYCQTDLKYVVANIVAAPKVEMHLDDVQGDGVCSGTDVTLTVKATNINVNAGNLTFSWEGDRTGNNTNSYTEEKLIEPRTFRCTVTDVNSQCASTASKFVDVYETPTVSIGATNNPVCYGTSTFMQATASSSSSTEFTYVWSRSGNSEYKVTDRKIWPVFYEDEVMSVVATDADHKCVSNPATYRMTVQKLPEISNMAKKSYCDGDSVHLILTGANAYYVNNQRMSGSDTAFVAPVGTNQYNVYGVAQRGSSTDPKDVCKSKTITEVVTVNMKPMVNLSGEQTVCQGTPLKLTAEVINYQDVTGLTYNWSEDQNNNTNKLVSYISTPRTITVKVTDPNGCYGKDEKTYTVYENPKASIEMPEGDMICNGSLANLVAVVEPQSDAYSYRWTRHNSSSYTETVSQITPTITAEDTFYLNVSDPHGCVSRQVSQLVKVVDKPKISILGYDKALCQDSLLQLTFSGADVYYVNNEELVNNVYTEKMTTARTAYYDVVGYINLSTGAQCFSEPIQQKVEVNPSPTLVVSGATTICEGSALSLTTTGAVKYEWNVADNATPDDVFELIPSGSVSGKYYYSVSGYSDNGCKSVQNIVVNTLKSPAFSINPSSEGVCTDAEVQLTAVPEGGATDADSWSYTWTGGQLTGATGKSVSTVVTGGNTFSATATNSIGCSSTQKVTIAQYAIPVINIEAYADIDNFQAKLATDANNTVSLCEGSQLKLFALPTSNSASVTSWVWDDDAKSAGQIFFPGDTIKNKLTYTHHVIGTTAQGCQSDAYINVQISKAPQVAIRSNNAACYGTDIVLTAMGATRYEWPEFDNATDAVYTTPATTLGNNTYTLYGYSADGCRGIAKFNVEVFENPMFSINSEGAYVCAGQQAYVAVEPDNAAADYAYSWSNGANTQAISPSYRAAGTINYSVTVTDQNTGCAVENVVPITYFANPKLSVANGSSNTVCRGSELVLVGEGANEYYWYVGANEFGPYYNDETFTSSPTVSQSYKLYGNNVNDNPITGEQVVCTSSIDYPVTVVNSPSIQILGNSTICYGESVKLSATGIDLNEQGVTTPFYYWENTQTTGAEMEDLFTAQSGAEVVYTVKGVSANGCTATKTKVVTMRPKTVIHIDAPSPVCEGFVATAKATGENIVSYRWDTDEVGDSIAHVINGDVTYTVTATDANDCKVSESATIKMQEKLELVDATVVSPENAILVNGVYSVCSGNNLTLKVSGASSYMWNKNPEKNASSVILAPVNDTIYTVEGIYGVCKATMSIPVHAIPAPTVSIEGDGAVCSGEAIKLTPYADESGLTYLWTAAADYDVDANNVITVHPIVDTKVTLSGSTAEGCRGVASTIIKVNNLPDLNIEGDFEPCVNSYTDLTGTGAISYQWTYDGRTMNSLAISALVKDQPTTVKLWGVDANNCHSEITRTITPIARPKFTIDGDLEICANTVLQLQPINDETACTYVWNGKDTTNIFNQFMTKAGTQNMSVTAILANKPGCSTTERFTVKVNELPQLYLTGNNYPCENSTMTVTAHGAEKYVWSHQPDVTCVPTATEGCTYTRNVNTGAPFSVKLTGWKNGCAADTVFTFQVHESPLVKIEADNEQACADGVVTLTAVSPDATTYDWGLDGAGKVITPVITATKTFKVTVIDKFGCEGSDEHEIELITSPTLSVYASEDYNSPVEVEDGEVITVCSGSPLSLTARGGKTYYWVDALESSDSDKYTLSNTTVGHRIKLTGYLGTCEASRTLTVKVLATPDPWIDGDIVVCEGDVVSLVANGADHYTWSGVTGVSGEHNEKLDYKLLYKPVDGVLTAWDNNHRCYTNLPFRLSFTEAPELFVATETDVCAGLPLEMNIVNPDSDVVYVWNQNFAGDTFIYHSVVPGVETVTVEAKKRGIGGCKAVKTYDITTHALPYISFSADGDNVKVGADSSITMCSGNNLILIPLGAKHYTWASEGLDTTVNTLILKPTTNTVYSIKGVDEYGCENSRDILVKTNPSPVLYSPMYGTPDEDGQITVYVCRNDSIDLDIAGADAYQWYNGTKEQFINVKPNFSRKYVVTGLRSENNCPTTVEYNVVVNELPNVTITDTAGRSGRVDLCVNSKVKVYSNGGDSYVWYDDQNNELSRKDTVIGYAGESSYYMVVATDSNKCVNSTKYIINTIERPKISFETAKPTVCAGERTTLYARSDEANSWTWFLNSRVLSYNSSLTITPTADANYTLYGHDKYGCGSTINVPLRVTPSPTIWVDGYSTKNGVSDTIEVCKYQELTLKMMGDAESYEWPSGSTDRSMVVESASISQTYQVTGIGANNCKTTIKIPVHVIPTAKISIKGDQYVCEGQSTVLTAEANANDYDNYVWSNNMIGTENQIYVFSDTVLSVTGYNSQSGCTNTVSFPIKKKALPQLAIQGETDVCKGGSSVIYATGANSYLWHDGSTGDAYVSTPQSNDVYKVIGTLDGCADSLTIPITVRIAPVIWADGLKPICQGEPLHLVAMGAEEFEWSDGSTTAEFVANPVDDITYTLTGTSNGCSSTIQVPVTVRPRPVVTYEGSTSVCLENATDLTAIISSDNTTDDGVGNKYRWYLGEDVISTQNVLNYVIKDSKTMFKLEGIDPAGCSNTVNITVTSVALPEIGLTGPSEICVGSPATYYVTGAKDYEWINGGDTVKGNVFKVSPETDTYYTLRAKSAMGCKADTTIFLVVNQLPEVSVAGNTSVCRGESLDLVGAGADTYLWSNGETTEHFTATPAASSEYQLIGTDANGCSNSVRFKVTVNELPQFAVRATSEGVCEGSLDTLFTVNDDVENSYTYFWTTAEGTNLSGDSIAPIIAKTTVFTITANNDNTHCQSSVNKTVYAYNNPILSTIGKDSVCLGQSLTLTAVGGDSKEYVWTNKGEVISTSPTVTITPSGSTEIYLTGKLASCTATKAFSITVVPLPYPSIAAVDGKDYVCRGSRVELVGSGLAEEGIYKWAVNGDTVKVDTAEFTTLSMVPSRSSVYTLTAINSFGCVSTSDMKIGIQELPKIGIAKNKNYVCPGQVDSVKFTATTNSKQNIDWNWTSRPGIDDILSNEINSSFTAVIDTTIMVYLHGTDELGCVGVDSTKITLRERDPFKFRVNPSCIDADSRKVRFAGLSPESEDTKWTWTVNMNEYSNDNTKLNGSVVNYEYPMPLADSILVGIHAVDPYGCIYDSTAYIYKWHDFWAPEAFSPNGDGLNDRFVFRGGRFIQEFHVIIYDRLGSIVYEGDENDLLRHTSDEIPTNSGWDGTYKGKACPWGVYGYTVTYKSTENSVSKSGKKKGMITLIR